jgi:glycosyltransferase involved in cell wall biosynthesis
MDEKMKKILILVNYFLPGIKGGGPIQSISNIADNLNHKYDIYILCYDRDLNDTKQYEGISTDVWLKKNNYNIFYTSQNNLKMKKLHKIIENLNPNTIYLNSLFDFRLSIMPLLMFKFGKIYKDKKIIIAPRGQLEPGALKLKSIRKKMFLLFSRIINLHHKILWHSTSSEETNNIKENFPKSRIYEISNLSKGKYMRNNPNIKKKIEGQLKIVFISRIHPKKNLLYAIQKLKEIDALIDFDIYGPIEDDYYWKNIQKEIRELSPKISVKYMGMLKNDEVVETFSKYNLFVFPTLSENYGHVIVESFAGGCPVLLSYGSTPWNDIEKENAGWLFRFDEKQNFINALNYIVSLSAKEFENISNSTYRYFEKISDNSKLIEKYFLMFS